MPFGAFRINGLAKYAAIGGNAGGPTYDLSAYTFSNTYTSAISSSWIGTVTMLYWYNDGTKMLLNDTSSNQAVLSFSTAWDISSASLDSQPNIIGANGGLGKVYNNKHLLNIDSSETISYVSFGSDYDWTNGSYNGTKNINGTGTGQTTAAGGLDISADGSKLYVGSRFPLDGVLQFSVSGDDFINASYDTSVDLNSVSGLSLGIEDILMSADGYKLYVSCGITNKYYEFDLSTAYDVSSASYNNVNLAFPSGYNPYVMSFTDDGKFVTIGDGRICHVWTS